MDKANVRNNYTYKYNYVKNNPAIKTLLIGNSHFENGINPYLIGDGTFDFAINRRWIYWDVQLMQELLPTLPNIKTIILPIGYHHTYNSPHYDGLMEADEECAYKYSKYMHVYYDRYPESIYLRSALWCNRMGIKYWVNEPVDSLGYDRLEGKEGDWRNKHNVPPGMLSKPYAQACYEEYRYYLIQLAKLCYEKDVRLIAVTCPCSDWYVKNTCTEGVHNLYALADSVRAYYPIEYKCYLGDAEFRQDSLYFNSSHLNSAGADKFALRVKSDFNL